MRLRTNRAELLTELIPMQGVVERKSTIPVLSHILLRVRDGQLHLAATDLDVSLTSWCDADVSQDGAVAVAARKFLEIVRALDGDEIELRAEDQSLRINAGKSRFKVRCLPADDFPTLADVGGGESFELPVAAFKRLISKIFFAISAEESRFQLNGALLKPKNGALELVATDGHRLALVEAPLEGLKEGQGVLVPRKALAELQRFDGEGNLKFQRGEHHLAFRIGRRELICRILEGSFPDYDKVIAKNNDRPAQFDRRALSDVVARVSLLTGDRSRAVKMLLQEGQLTLSATNPDLGEAVEELSCDFEGPDLTLGLNPDYLAQFLGAVETEKVRLDLKDENSQCLGQPVADEGGRYLCVIMPIRL